MSEYITLIGTDDVVRAGYEMRDAADTMMRASNNIYEALNRHQIALEGHRIALERLCELMNPHEEVE